jgi:hypothetical protein
MSRQNFETNLLLVRDDPEVDVMNVRQALKKKK